MMTLTRFLVVLCCSSLSLAVQANGTFRYCPASPVAATDDSISPFSLIWDIDGGTTSPRTGGSPGEYVGFSLVAALASDDALEVLFTGSLSPDCALDGTLVFADEDGVPLKEEPVGIVGGDGLTFTAIIYEPEQEASRQIVRYGLENGKATGCTLEELSTVTASATVLKRRPDVEEVCSGLACAEPLTSEPLQPVFRRAMLQEIAILTGGQLIDLQCRAAASGDYVSPYDLVWDIDEGTTSQGVKQSTEMVIIVTPYITRSSAPPSGTVLSCEETISRDGYVVDFLPKVKVEVVVEDDKGNSSTEIRELDATTQTAVLTYPYLDGGISRHLQRVKVKAQGSSCFDVQATLYTVDTESGNTLTKQRLGGVIRKAVPPPEFADGNGGDDLTQ